MGLWSDSGAVGHPNGRATSCVGVGDLSTFQCPWLAHCTELYWGSPRGEDTCYRLSQRVVTDHLNRGFLQGVAPRLRHGDGPPPRRLVNVPCRGSKPLDFRQRN